MEVKSSTDKRPRLLTELTGVIREELRLAIAWNDAAAVFTGLHPTDATILFFLYEKGQCTASQASRVARLTTGATTAALIRLERAGFIVREKDKRDRRCVIIRPKELPSQFRVIRRLNQSELSSTVSDKSNTDIQALITHRRQTNAMLTHIIEQLTK